MLRLVCCALAILSCACGSKDSGDEPSSPEDKAAENAATWSDTAKVGVYNGCFKGHTEDVWNRYCICATERITKMMPYSEMRDNFVAAAEKVKASDIGTVCTKFAKGE